MEKPTAAASQSMVSSIWVMDSEAETVTVSDKVQPIGFDTETT